MSPFDIAAILVATAAACGYLNRKLLDLPATSGTLAVAFFSGFLVAAADAAVPALNLQGSVARFLGEIDFNQTLMHGMLAFLLFAGAMHVDIECLADNGWTIGSLATLGVVISTAIVALLTRVAVAAAGVQIPFSACLAFGALISPTDPIAVMGLLKDLRAPASLEAQIAGESLFNDGVGVAVFFAVTAFGGPTTLAIYFLREVAGGIALGLVLGFVAYRALKTLDEHALELLITLALAMFTYASAFWIGVSGPIAVVVAGLFIGNRGRQFAMSEETRQHVDAFWSMIDEILNAVLFLLLGLGVFVIRVGLSAVAAVLLTIPIALVARLASVALPVAVLRLRRQFVRGVVPVLTWAGLRGGISIAMVLSMPPSSSRRFLMAATYAVVVFSVLVQGLTVRRLLVRYGLAEGAAR